MSSCVSAVLRVNRWEEVAALFSEEAVLDKASSAWDSLCAEEPEGCDTERWLRALGMALPKLEMLAGPPVQIEQLLDVDTLLPSLEPPTPYR